MTTNTQNGAVPLAARLVAILGLLLLPSVVDAGFDDVTQGTIYLNGNFRYYSELPPLSGLIGVGTFQYAPTSVDLFYDPHNPPEPWWPPGTLSLPASDNYRVVTDIQITLPDTSFGPNYSGSGGAFSTYTLDYLLTVPPNAPESLPDSSVPGPSMVMLQNTGAPFSTVVQQDNWAFGNSRGTILWLDRNGSWMYSSSHSFGSGTWTLLADTPPQAVPEPLTVIATLLAGGFGLFFRQYNNSQARRRVTTPVVSH